MLTIDNDLMRVRFDGPAFSRMGSYDLFLRCKKLPESTTVFDPDAEAYTIEAPARFAPMLGVEVPRVRAQDLPYPKFLYDDQTAILDMALPTKRFACWSGCGSGKTVIGLEFARQACHRTGGRALITTVNEVVNQWVEEAQKFYGDDLPVIRLNSRAEMKEWCQHGTIGGVPTIAKVAVTNYEKWNPEDLERQVVSEARHLCCIILDEASRLRTGGGKQKWALIKSCRGIEYKLTLTATPAPNELMEYASQAAFLEKMRDIGEIIWTFFTRDKKSHRWTVKKHAREQFFRFMAGWSIYVQNPKRYGWRLDQPDVPEPTILVHEVAPTAEQQDFRQRFSGESNGQMLLWGSDDTNAIQRAKLSQVAKGFCYTKGEAAGKFVRVPSKKPAFVADLTAREVEAGLPVLCWTVFDAEATILAEELRVRCPSLQFDVLEKTKQGRDLSTDAESFPTGPPAPETSPPGGPSSPPTPNSRRRLNPSFVEWLMGAPPGWTSLASIDCERWATWWCRSRRLLRSLCSERGC